MGPTYRLLWRHFLALIVHEFLQAQLDSHHGHLIVSQIGRCQPGFPLLLGDLAQHCKDVHQRHACHISLLHLMLTSSQPAHFNWTPRSQDSGLHILQLHRNPRVIAESTQVEEHLSQSGRDVLASKWYVMSICE